MTAAVRSSGAGVRWVPRALRAESTRRGELCGIGGVAVSVCVCGGAGVRVFRRADVRGGRASGCA